MRKQPNRLKTPNSTNTVELIALLDKLDKEATPAPWVIGTEQHNSIAIQYDGRTIFLPVRPSVYLTDTKEMHNNVDIAITLRNNLNTIVQWGRVVEAAKRVIATEEHKPYRKTLEQLDAHTELCHALSLIEE